MNEIKKLGFGFMRLPRNEENLIDIEQVKSMVDEFMAAGFNYFDTARVYRGSEIAIRQTLVERYPREKYFLATKNAAWRVETREEALEQFEKSLDRTGAGYFDYYLLHNLGDSRTKKFDDFKIWDFVKEKKSEGKVKHIGFSFHSTAEELEEILKNHPEMEFVQLQINYADWENPIIQSKKCYEVARKYNKPVIIMEPVKGGMLAKPPESVEKILKDADENSSCASWAIRFAANLEGVITVLSGMSSIEQVRDNISTMKNFSGLDENQTAAIKKARDEFLKIPIIPCTFCRYCTKVCPQNVDIPRSFEMMNRMTLYGDKKFATHRGGLLANMRDGKKSVLNI